MPTIDLPTPTPAPGTAGALPTIALQKKPGQTIAQLLRFGLVGCVNTMIDLLVLNILLWLWPTRNPALLLLANSIAYAFGALNCFILNRYWTFQRGGSTNAREVTRFVLTTLAVVACNDLLMWLLNGPVHPAQVSPSLWINSSKVVAIGGTVLISYLGMRLWVFVQSAQETQGLASLLQRGSQTPPEHRVVRESTRPASQTTASTLLTTRSLSLVLPAYNEEQIIAATVKQAVHALAGWTRDFEVIVVNDGSSDRTGTILAALRSAEPRVRVLTHEHNRGYGATLADGFAAATKELTMFMDSDGQFDILDLERLLPFIGAYDAVIGYRAQRQDTWMRKLNAWGWKMVVRLVLGVHVRDIDCAFKVLRTDFLHGYPLETRGAMINAELLYKLKRAGCTIREIGVRHLPRQGGKATGAKQGVIARAFRELFHYAREWRREESLAHALSAPRATVHARYPGRKENAMIDTNPQIAASRLARLEKQSTDPLSRWQRLALVAVVLTSIFMNFYQLGQSGFGNLFYAAGVRSMADSLRNFFFVSYDPGGFVTVDKPPLGFWLQTLSVKFFGFTPFSIFLPQALAGVLAVLVLFILVRRHFGFMAGLLAALALAISPLSVVTARNNTIDSTLALTLLVGAWTIMRAAETGKWRWLLLSAILVGIGFNVKMMEAYLIVPAFGLLYLLAAPRKFWMRAGQLLIALLLLLAVSLSWAIAVDLTPNWQRPYVGSSQDNSEIGLAFGYNGVDRLLGHFGFGGHHGSTSDANSATSGKNGDTRSSAQDNLAGLSGERTNRDTEPRAGRLGFGDDAPGLLRLFNEPLGGQISWLLPIALLGMLALVSQRLPRFQRDRQQQALLLWGTWLLVMGVFFSLAGFFHQYYMVTFAPAICALFGIGIVVMWQDYRRAGWRGWLLPLALVATAAEQVHFITSNPAWGTWLIPLIAIPCALAALALGLARLLSRMEISSRALMPVFGAGLVALLLTPALWSALPGIQNTAISTPTAGPARHYGFGHFGHNNNTANPTLISYLEKNQGNAKFLVATPSSMSANAIILATNQPVMAMGGFFGRDPILTASQLSALVASGTVRFFLLNNPTRQPATPSKGQTRPAGFFWLGRNSQTALTSWIAQHCGVVPASKWQSASTGTATDTMGYTTQLYDCAREK